MFQKSSFFDVDLHNFFIVILKPSFRFLMPFHISLTTVSIASRIYKCGSMSYFSGATQNRFIQHGTVFFLFEFLTQSFRSSSATFRSISCLYQCWAGSTCASGSRIRIRVHGSVGSMITCPGLRIRIYIHVSGSYLLVASQFSIKL